MRPVLMLVYLATALWMGGAHAAKASRLFPAISLMVAASLTAAIAVDPFLYAAIFIIITVLACIPLISPAGKPVGQGPIRFLTFYVLGMPFILISGWLLSQSVSGESQQIPALLAASLAGLGLAFFMSVFPFHTWIPLVTEKSHPYSAGYVIFIIPTIVSLFLLTFLVRYVIPVVPSSFWIAIRFAGILMVFIGGIWCAFQEHLGRMLGFAVISEIGLILLALSLGPGQTTPFIPQAIPIFFAQILVRGIAIAVWALALSAIEAQSTGLSFHQVQGVARRVPFAVSSLILALFSLAGVPLLAGFPVRLALWNSLASISLPTALLALLGGAGMLVGALRAMAVLITGEDHGSWQINERPTLIVLLVLGWLMLILMGLFPQWFLKPVSDLAVLFITQP
jgi:NADH-quinone oxidoreductase subunit N